MPPANEDGGCLVAAPPPVSPRPNEVVKEVEEKTLNEKLAELKLDGAVPLMPKDYVYMNRLKSTSQGTQSTSFADRPATIPGMGADERDVQVVADLTAKFQKIAMKERSTIDPTPPPEDPTDEDGTLLDRGPIYPSRQMTPLYSPYGQPPQQMAGRPGGYTMMQAGGVPCTPAEYMQAQRQKNIFSGGCMPQNFYPTTQLDLQGACYDPCAQPAIVPAPYSPAQESNASYPSPQQAFSPNSHTSGDSSSPFADQYIPGEELRRLLNQNCELPDDLSDFILKYSRRYSTDTPPVSASPESLSRKSSFGESVLGSPDPANCESPSATDSSSGGSPKVTVRKSAALKAARLKRLAPKFQSNPPVAWKTGRAKERLCQLMGDRKELGWAWAVRLFNEGRSAFYASDYEGDTLLHISVWNADIPKIYSLVEHILKDECPPWRHPIDVQNRLCETPLFMAVEKRLVEVISYLLESGANPNLRTNNFDGDAPLHYAAARGMTEIVQALCECPTLNLDLPNGNGMSPLLCAVRNHGVIEEDSQCLINNKPVIRKLLGAGADPKIPEHSPSRKTVLHYAVERMDPELVEIFGGHLSAGDMQQLVNTPMYDGATPLQLLTQMAGCRPSGMTRGQGEEELRRKMYATLVDCGADLPQTHPSPPGVTDLYCPEP